MVAELYRCPFREATLRPEDRRLRGAVTGVDFGGRPLVATAVYLAGLVAAHGMEGYDLTKGIPPRGWYDALCAGRYADGLGGEEIAMITARVARLVHVTHRAAVDAVAEALLLHPEQRVSRFEVARLIEDWSPDGLLSIIEEQRAALGVAIRNGQEAGEIAAQGYSGPAKSAEYTRVHNGRTETVRQGGVREAKPWSARPAA